MLLILTVGTGTAGRESFIAEGLRRTVELLNPRGYWLIPSSSPTSIDVADFIRENFPDTFIPWGVSHKYCCINEPDSLETCRTIVRRVITEARKQILPKERIIVNPTSGTKQMSAGATIAALDEHVGELVFTVGERADGVVRTGSEKLETFDASGYFAEQTYRQAYSLYEIGAYHAASEILAQCSKYSDEATVCRSLHQWERLDYRSALNCANRVQGHPMMQPLLPSLRTLANDCITLQPSAAIVSDLLRSARHCRDTKDTELSITRACKALEMGLRLDLYQRAKIYEPYKSQQFCNIQGLPTSLIDQLQRKQRGGHIFLGIRDLVDVLHALGSEIASKYLSANSDAREVVEIRNNLTHQIRAVTFKEAQMAIKAVSQILLTL